jgi:hypothetical protein
MPKLDMPLDLCGMQHTDCILKRVHHIGFDEYAILPKQQISKFVTLRRKSTCILSL